MDPQAQSLETRCKNFSKDRGEVVCKGIDMRSFTHHIQNLIISASVKALKNSSQVLLLCPYGFCEYAIGICINSQFKA